MPQSGYTPIQIYSSSTPTNAPSAGNLTNDTKGSELAINIADKNLFFKDSSNVVNTVPIRQSGAASDGWLSSTDWNTFNNKQPAGTYVTSVTGTAPVVSSGGTTPAISMAAATTSVNGYLTSTDWNTFNGKQAALVSGSNIKTVSGVSLLGSGDLGTIGTGYGGTGLTSFTSGGIVYASSTSALATSSNLVYDGTNLGLYATPSAWGGAYKSFAINNPSNNFFGWNGGALCGIAAGAYIDSGYTWRYNITGQAVTMYQANDSSGGQVWLHAPSGTSGNSITWTTFMKLHDSGGLSLGNTTDPGATNLSVSGNVVIATSGKGIDFSAAGGDILTIYDEGTWNPSDVSGAGIVLTSVTATYTRIGRQVTVQLTATVPTTASGAGVLIAGLPFLPNTSGYMGVCQDNSGIAHVAFVSNGSSGRLEIYPAGSMTIASWSSLSTQTIYATATYFI